MKNQSVRYEEEGENVNAVENLVAVAVKETSQTAQETFQTEETWNPLGTALGVFFRTENFLRFPSSSLTGRRLWAIFLNQ